MEEFFKKIAYYLILPFVGGRNGELFDWIDLLISLLLYALLIGIIIFVVFIIKWHRKKKKEKLKKEANRKNFMDERVDKLREDEISKK